MVISAKLPGKEEPLLREGHSVDQARVAMIDYLAESPGQPAARGGPAR